MSDREMRRATETAFTEDESRSLKILVEMIIPSSAEHGVPGAGDAAIFADILATAGPRYSEVGGALSALDGLARQSHGGGFATLPADPDARAGIVAAFRRLHPAAAELLATITVQCYYRDDRVMGSLGMEARPPHPDGFTVDQGDWSLLDPVRGRPKFYREAP